MYREPLASGIFLLSAGRDLDWVELNPVSDYTKTRKGVIEGIHIFFTAGKQLQASFKSDINKLGYIPYK